MKYKIASEIFDDMYKEFKSNPGEYSMAPWYKFFLGLGISNTNIEILTHGGLIVGAGKLYENVRWLAGKNKEDHRKEWRQAVWELQTTLNKIVEEDGTSDE